YRKLGRNDRAIARFAAEADLYARQGFLLKAIAICKLVLEIEPRHTATQRHLAQLYQAKAQLESATTIRAEPPLRDKDPRVRTLRPGQPLESISLAKAVPHARPVAPHVMELPTAEDFANAG